MADNGTLQLHLLNTDIQVRAGDDEEKIRQIEEYVQNELNTIKSKNQFANHIHIALLGCLNLAETLFDLNQQLEENTRNHSDELIYYKNIESKKNEEQKALNEVIQSKTEEIDNLKTKHKNELAEIYKQTNDKINELNESHSKELELLKQDKEASIKIINDEKDKKIAELISENEARLQQLTSENDKMLEDLQKQLKEEYDRINQEKDTIILNVKEDKKNEIEQLTQEKDAIITRLRKERESELRSLHQEKDVKIEQLTNDNETLTNINVSMTKDLDNKNELLNQYREKLKQSKDENDINRKSIIDLQNQLFENQIELAKLQKQIEGTSSSQVKPKSSEDRNLNEVIFDLKNQEIK